MLGVCLTQPNQPRGADFLTEAEQEFLEQRLVLHQSAKAAVAAVVEGASSPPTAEVALPASTGKKEFSIADFQKTVSDWRVWSLAVLYMLVLNALYSLSFFLPAIIGQLNYSVFTANLVSAPVYLCAALVTIYVSWSSDRRRERFFHCIVPGTVAGVFFFLFAWAVTSSNTGLQLFTLIILVAAAWCLVPPILALLMAVLKSPTSSATGTAVCVSIGNIGGYVGPAICAWSQTSYKSYGPACIVLAFNMLLFAAGMYLLRSRLTAEIALQQFDLSHMPTEAAALVDSVSETASIALTAVHATSIRVYSTAVNAVDLLHDKVDALSTQAKALARFESDSAPRQTAEP